MLGCRFYYYGQNKKKNISTEIDVHNWNRIRTDFLRISKTIWKQFSHSLDQIICSFIKHTLTVTMTVCKCRHYDQNKWSMNNNKQTRNAMLKELLQTNIHFRENYRFVIVIITGQHFCYEHQHISNFFLNAVW